MSLNPEWLRRVTNWRDELPQHFYRPLGVVALSGFVTKEQLTAEQAQAARLRPDAHRHEMGRKVGIRLVQRAPSPCRQRPSGQRIALRADAGGESAVWINGRLVGAVDRQHTEITLAMAGEAGARYDVLIEAYAGHGLRTAGKGPVGYGRESVPEPPPAQVVVGETTFGVWNEPVYQLWLDVETLLQTRNQLDPDSLRVAEIDAGLRDFTLIADLELPPAEFLATVEQARARLKPLLACVNGSTAPTLFAIGHSHIDVAWLWPLQETERKMRAHHQHAVGTDGRVPRIQVHPEPAAPLLDAATTLPGEVRARSRRRSRPGRSSPKAACGSRPTPTSPAARR